MLTYQEIAKPVPGPGQVLLRVQAAEINPLDLKMRSGAVKTIHPVWPEDILGFGLSGIIEAVGRGVDKQRIGEAVYGTDSPFVRGGYAEYVVASAVNLQPKPKNLPFTQAAAVPVGVLTAHNALFAMAHLQAGQSILIHGASGTVGSFAVQLAKRAGAHVVATASSSRMDYVLGLGADEVIDYQKQNFDDLVTQQDVILDTIGGTTRERSWGVLKRGGILVTLVPPLPDPAIAARYGVRAVMNQNTGDESQLLRQITDILEQGTLRPHPIGLTLPLQQASHAHALLEQGTVHGHIVLEI
ncbi:NADPH:quinone reductase [Dictyobacter alpinus]|uniref:NADPH:quinone reductase n=1 Tax=Dictyobacter alpinus TaxID=2014873 RepID=A0A402BKN7_9CHLR|nr:NADP-dependent oxidoreductase [Dictyobacter alpinus]GCE31886.1 NADPH:quinone reductase [Dictyobacter alpinus]